MVRIAQWRLEDIKLAEVSARPKGPEVDLWTTCLCHGVRNFLRGPGHSRRQVQAWKTDAYWLLRSGHGDEVGSFEWICERVGLDEAWVRRLALSLYPSEREE